MALLDSDILISYLRGNQEARSFIENLEKMGEKFFTSSINAFELFEGTFLSENRDQSLANAEGLLRTMEILSFSEMVSKKAAHISATLRKNGRIIDFQDIAIASVCVSNGQKIVTRNIKDFSKTGIATANY